MANITQQDQIFALQGQVNSLLLAASPFISYAAMADAPPWPNFSLLHYYTILLCPIVITYLLSMLPAIIYDLSRC